MSNCCCDVFSYILPLLLFWPGRTFFFCADIIVLFLEGNIKSCLICVFFVFFYLFVWGLLRTDDESDDVVFRSWIIWHGGVPVCSKLKALRSFSVKGGKKKYIKRGFSTGKSSVVAYYSENAINISWPFISSHAKRLMRIKRALTLVYTKKRWCNCQFFFIASNIFRKALQKMGSFELTRKQLAHTTLENNLGREMKGRVLKGLTLSKKKRVPLCNTRWWMLA